MSEFHRRFTEEEDEVILSMIMNNPFNIAEALRQSAIQIGRSVASCNTRYYKVLTNPSHPVSQKYNVVFMTVGNKRVLVSRKLTREEARATKTDPKDISESAWNRFWRRIFHR